MRSLFRRLLGLATLAIALSLTPAVSALAATPSWHAALPVTSGSPAPALNGVSCGSPTFCMGVGGSTAALADGGPLVQAAPDGTNKLTAVSCAAATRFCVLVDDHGNAITYDKDRFGSPNNVDGTVAFRSVSCPASTTVCMAIDANDMVFQYAGSAGTWTSTQLPPPTNFNGVTQVSCSSPSFCVALAGSTAGTSYSTWDGSSWTTNPARIDNSGGAVQSLTCTSSTFCLATDIGGNAVTWSGATVNPWTVTPVATGTPDQKPLRSACAGTTCQAIDNSRRVFTTPNGTTWTLAGNIAASTGIGSPTSMTCATATLCVIGDFGGQATTFAVALTPPARTASIAGTAVTTHTLAATRATLQDPSDWLTDRWVRCSAPGPGGTCVTIPGATGTSYTLTDADLGKYILLQETDGVGLEQRALSNSNPIGPVSATPSTPPASPPPPSGPAPMTGLSSAAPAPTPKPRPHLSGKTKTTKKGVVSLVLKCPRGSRCRGKATLSVLVRPKPTKKKRHPKAKRIAIGSARYSIAAGKGKTVKVKLTKTGRKLLKKHDDKLAARLTITPTGAKGRSRKVTLKVKR